MDPGNGVFGFRDSGQGRDLGGEITWLLEGMWTCLGGDPPRVPGRRAHDRRGSRGVRDADGGDVTRYPPKHAGKVMAWHLPSRRAPNGVPLSPRCFPLRRGNNLPRAQLPREEARDARCRPRGQPTRGQHPCRNTCIRGLCMSSSKARQRATARAPITPSQCQSSEDYTRARGSLRRCALPASRQPPYPAKLISPSCSSGGYPDHRSL